MPAASVGHARLITPPLDYLGAVEPAEARGLHAAALSAIRLALNDNPQDSAYRAFLAKLSGAGGKVGGV
jgi:hypothetical protein